MRNKYVARRENFQSNNKCQVIHGDHKIVTPPNTKAINIQV